MKKIIIIIGAVVLILIGAVAFDLKFFNQPEQIACTMEAKLCLDGSSVGRTGPNCEFVPCPAQNNIDFKNGAYLIDGQIVVLKNGISDVDIVTGAASKNITRYFGNEVKGNFNGNGLQDIAFLLTQDSGGSGTFFYVVGALRETDGFQGMNAIFLGDRIAPQTTEFKNGEIIVNYADRGLDEPMTATPSIGVSRYFKVVDNRLTEIEK